MYCNFNLYKIIDMKVGLIAQASIALYLSILLVLPVHGQNCQNINHSGYKTVTQDTGTETIVREYILDIPANYNPDVATALIINMHGFGDCAAEYSFTVGGFYNFDELAHRENIIVAYPQAAYRPEKEDHFWEPGDNGEPHLYDNDVYFIEQLIRDIDSEYNIDLSRVYAAGYSNGGMMAYSLACNRQELFAGIGIMSGVMLEEDCNDNYSIPIIVFHGIADGVLPYDGNQYFQPTGEVVSFWLDKNNIPESSLVSTELKDGKVIKDEYSGGNDNTCISFYTINEEFDKPGDHVWFSEAIDGSTPNQILWDFFSNNCALTSSTEEQSEIEQQLSISPNPIVDKLTITTSRTHGQAYSIYTMQGKRVLSGITKSNSHIIDVSALAPNTYLINFGEEVRKLVKVE